MLVIRKLVRSILVSIKNRIKVKKKKVKKWLRPNRYTLELGCHCYLQQNHASILPVVSLCGTQICYRLSRSSKIHMALQSYFLLGESPDGTVSPKCGRSSGSALAPETTHSFPSLQSSPCIRLCLALSGAGDTVLSEVRGWVLAQFVVRG